MSSSRFQKTIEFLIDNLVDIVTILMATYLVIRHRITPFTQNDIGSLATWILAVLGLIAVSGLWDRNRRLRRIEKLSQDSHDLILHNISGKSRAGNFFLTEGGVSDKTFSAATTILLAGITLTRTTRQYMHILGQRFVAGATIRMIIIDPSLHSVMDVMAARSMGDTTPEYWQTRMNTVKAVIHAIANTPGSTGKLEIGYLPYIPSFGLSLIDPDQPHGVCYVELYHHRSAESNPFFELTVADDTLWYKFFLNQWEILWNSCRIEEISEGVSNIKS
jgi:hypothetical protein